MKTRRQIMALLLCAVMVVSMLPMSAMAAGAAPAVKAAGETGFKDAFAKYFKVGCAASYGEIQKTEAQQLILTQYNSVTCENEMKPDSTLDQAASQAAGETETKVRLTSNARAILKFCEDNGIPMRGHVFVWHSQTPGWFFRQGWTNNGAYVTPEVMDQRLESYIKNLTELIAHDYPNLDMYAWDVCNEVFTDSNPANLRPANNSGWMAVYGNSDYIYHAFEYAKKYCPEGTDLTLNDYNEYDDGKLEALYNLAKDLYDKGLLTTFGMQSHLTVGSPSIEKYKKALEKYCSIGCKVMVTELDVQANNNQQQAEYYQQLFELYVDHADKIDAIVFWGTQDGMSWRNGGVLPFDNKYQPKPCYEAILEAVSDHEHTFEATVVPPTCTEEGYTGEVCTHEGCGRTRVTARTPALGHDWDEGTTTVAPTDDTAGLLTMHCTRCDAVKTKRLPPLNAKVPADIDFTDTGDADKFEIEGSTGISIAAGTGLTLVSTTSGPEPAKQNITEQMADAVLVPADGDFSATLHFDFNANGSQGFYEFFGFYVYADNNNMAGIRGGNNGMQDFVRNNGSITEETKSTNSGLAAASTHWLRLVKNGDTLECYVSADGENFGEPIFTHDISFMDAEYILIDAYSGMATGYTYILKSLEFEAVGGDTPTPPACEHKETEVKGAKEATCTEAGQTGDTVCKACGKVLKKSEAIPATGHTWGEWTVTTPPTTDAEGEETRTCSKCNETEKRAVEKLAPVFVDVEQGRFYHDSVYWAVNLGITKGTDGDHFSPNDSCTRAEAVMFLYRVAGQPAVKTDVTNPFVDVGEGRYYYKAVMWAVSVGITNGTDATHFNPNQEVNRATFVTFLWRAAGQPAAGTSVSFSDVDSDRFYAKAVAWAVDKGITNGVSGGTMFDPNGICTRGHVVTFLNRAYQ